MFVYLFISTYVVLIISTIASGVTIVFLLNRLDKFKTMDEYLTESKKHYEMVKADSKKER